MRYELHNLVERGPYPGEDFFRMKVTGDGETVWFNVPPEKMRQVEELLSSSEIWNELGECRLCETPRWPDG